MKTVRIHFLGDVLICRHPEIVLPWQRDVTNSPLYYRIVIGLTSCNQVSKKNYRKRCLSEQDTYFNPNNVRRISSNIAPLMNLIISFSTLFNKYLRWPRETAEHEMPKRTPTGEEKTWQEPVKFTMSTLVISRSKPV